MPRGAGEDWAADHVRRWNAKRSSDDLGELLKWQRDRAYAVACRIVGREADAEDVVQEAFTGLLTTAPALDSPEALRAIVNRAVAQRAIDLVRKAGRRRRLEKVMLTDPAEAPATGFTGAERAEALAALGEEMASVEPEDRALLTLCCQEGRPVAEAASALEVPRETARDRLRQLLGDLRARLSRRGVSLAFLPLVALFREGGKAQAGEALCLSLDAALPGLSCKSIPAAAAAGLTPAGLLAQLGLVSAIVTKLAVLAAALAVAGAGLFIWHSADTPAAVPAAIPATRTPAGPAAAAGTMTTPGKMIAAESQPAPPEPGAEQEVDVPLAEVPTAVRRAAEGAVAGLVLREAERITRRGYPDVFELDGRADGREYEITVTATDARVLGVKEVPPDDDDDEGGKPAGDSPGGKAPPVVETF